MRDSIFRESLQLGSKPRNGLFSIPGSLAIGDDNYDKPKPARRGADGKVPTEAKNFLTNHAKKGSIDDVLFQKSSYITVGDPYNPKAQTMKGSLKETLKAAGHD